MDRVVALNEESNSLTRKVAMLLPADAVEADCVRQDSYNEDLEALQSALATYLSLRKNDAPSDTKSEPESNNPTPVSPTPATIIQAEVPDISEWCKQLESKLEALLISTRKEEPVIQNRSTTSYRREAPDDWIDLYVQSQNSTFFTPEYSSHSSIKIDLSTFDGSSLRWFEWIGLFKTLVHDTSCGQTRNLLF